MATDPYFDDFDEDELSDEELDELYRPRKCNSRKSLAPLFVYKILEEMSSDGRHMSQNEILAELKKYPYEIELERKALSRVLHGLMDMGFGIIGKKGQGFWHTSDRRYYDGWELESYEDTLRKIGSVA